MASGAVSATLLLDDGAFALDADAVDAVFAVSGDELRLASGHGPLRASSDPARRLFRVEPGGQVLASGPRVVEAAGAAADWAAFATAAQALGTGEALLRADGRVREAAHPVRGARSDRSRRSSIGWRTR